MEPTQTPPESLAPSQESTATVSQPESAATIVQPTGPAPLPMAGSGVSGDLLTKTENTEDEHKRFVVQNPHMLLVNLDGSTIYAKQGAMAAYQGAVDFKYHGGGMGRFMKKVFTGENLPLMECSGQGDLFLADNGSEVYVLDIANDQLSINGPNLLAFEQGLEWDIKRIKAGAMGFVAGGGLFNITLTGNGSVAVTSFGQPVVLKVDQTTRVDVNCVIAWTTSLQTSIASSMKAEAFIGRGSGEAFQMEFNGNGFVVVQPGEGPTALAAAVARG